MTKKKFLALAGIAGILVASAPATFARDYHDYNDRYRYQRQVQRWQNRHQPYWASTHPRRARFLVNHPQSGKRFWKKHWKHRCD